LALFKSSLIVAVVVRTKVKSSIKYQVPNTVKFNIVFCSCRVPHDSSGFLRVPPGSSGFLRC